MAVWNAGMLVLLGMSLGSVLTNLMPSQDGNTAKPSSNRPPPKRPDHGPSPRSAMEREGDRSPRAARIGPVAAPNKGLRAVFAPLVDYGDDSDDEPDSPGQNCALCVDHVE